MTAAHVHLVLNELDAMLTHILERTHIPGQPEPVTRYAKARWRLTNDAAPGFPANTPGNGNPGGGTGATRETYTDNPDEDLVDDRERITGHQPERLALNGLGAQPADLETLHHHPAAVYVHTWRLARHVSLPRPDTTIAPNPTLRLDWALTTLRTIATDDIRVNVASHAGGLGICHTIHRRTTDLYTTVKRWGYDAATPKVDKTDRELLAADLTGEWCVSCLRVGRKDSRYKRDLCQWCWRFERTEGFLPPFDVMQARADYKPVTEAMIEPHRQRHRDRQAHAKRPA